jgi:hypothetical protein
MRAEMDDWGDGPEETDYVSGRKTWVAPPKPAYIPPDPDAPYPF